MDFKIRKSVFIFCTIIFVTSCKPENPSSAVVVEEERRKPAYPSEMEPHRASYEKSGMEYVSIEARPSKTDPWQSKFLGLPYLLKDSPYPIGLDKKPLQLLAQINFDDMPSLSAYQANQL